jgi:hypothetical protein
MHPFTAKHLEVLESLLSYKIISPISKLLACGDLGKPQKTSDRDYLHPDIKPAFWLFVIGVGAMAEVETIVNEIDQTIHSSQAKLTESDLKWKILYLLIIKNQLEKRELPFYDLAANNDLNFRSLFLIFLTDNPIQQLHCHIEFLCAFQTLLKSFLLRFSYISIEVNSRAQRKWPEVILSKVICFAAGNSQGISSSQEPLWCLGLSVSLPYYLLPNLFCERRRRPHR